MAIYKVGNVTIDGSVNAAIKARYLLDKNEQPTIPPPLEETKAWAISEIRRLVEETRGEHITLLPGKISEYEQKWRSHDDWVAEGKPPNPDPSKYPIAEAERKEYDSVSLSNMLQVYGDKNIEWKQASAGITANERRALNGIEAAQNEKDIEIVLENL